MCPRLESFVRKRLCKLRCALCETIKLCFRLSANYAQDTLARGVGQWEMDHESPTGLLRLLDQICSFILPILHEGSRGNDFQSSDCLRPYTSKVCRSVLLLCTRERISYDRDKGVQSPFHRRVTISPALISEGQLSRSVTLDGRNHLEKVSRGATNRTCGSVLR